MSLHALSTYEKQVQTGREAPELQDPQSLLEQFTVRSGRQPSPTCQSFRPSAGEFLVEIGSCPLVPTLRSPQGGYPTKSSATRPVSSPGPLCSRRLKRGLRRLLRRREETKMKGI